MNKKEKVIHGKPRQNKNKHKAETLLRGERNLKHYEQHQSQKNTFKDICSS